MLYLCVKVIHELDDKKNHPLLKDRAQRVIKEIRAILADNGKVRENITLKTITEEIRPEDVPQGLNPFNADDVILASVLRYMKAFPNEALMVVSEDLAMEVKCTSRNIALFRPNENSRLPDLENQQGKKLKQTLAELEKLKNALPDLDIRVGTFDEDADPPFIVNLPRTTPELNIENEMEKLQRTYPHRTKREVSQAAVDNLHDRLRDVTLFGQNISAEEYQRYNKELDTFFVEYRSYLKRLALWQAFQERSFKCHFHVINNGGTPAQNIDVHLHFPDGMDIFDGGKLPPSFKTPKPPNSPKEPMKDIEKLFSRLSFDHPSIDQLYGYSLPHLSEDDSNVTSPTIRKSSSYDVHYNIEHLKHGYSEPLGELLVAFPSRNQAHSFHVDFSITADNHPDKKSGQIHFSITSEQDTTGLPK